MTLYLKKYVGGVKNNPARKVSKPVMSHLYTGGALNG